MWHRDPRRRSQRDPAAVQLRQLLDDGESEAEPAVTAGGAGVGRAFDRAERAGVLLRRQLAGLQQVNPPHQRIDRRPQLVRQGRQELVLQAVGVLRLTIELLVLPRQAPQPILGVLQLGDVEERPDRAAYLALWGQRFEAGADYGGDRDGGERDATGTQRAHHAFAISAADAPIHCRPLL